MYFPSRHLESLLRDKDLSLTGLNRNGKPNHLSDYRGPYSAGIHNIFSRNLPVLCIKDKPVPIPSDASDTIMQRKHRTLFFRAQRHTIRQADWIDRSIRHRLQSSVDVFCKIRFIVLHFFLIHHPHRDSAFFHRFTELGHLEFFLCLCQEETSSLFPFKIIIQLFAQSLEHILTCLCKQSVKSRLLIADKDIPITSAACRLGDVSGVDQDDRGSLFCVKVRHR